MRWLNVNPPPLRHTGSDVSEVASFALGDRHSSLEDVHEVPDHSHAEQRVLARRQHGRLEDAGSLIDHHFVFAIYDSQELLWLGAQHEATPQLRAGSRHRVRAHDLLPLCIARPDDGR